MGTTKISGLKKPVYKYDSEYNLLRAYKTRQEISSEGLNPITVVQAASRGYRYKGFIFSYYPNIVDKRLSCCNERCLLCKLGYCQSPIVVEGIDKCSNYDVNHPVKERRMLNPKEPVTPWVDGYKGMWR